MMNNSNNSNSSPKPNAVFVSVEKQGGGVLYLDFSKNIIRKVAEVIGDGCNSLKKLYFPYGDNHERLCLLYDPERKEKPDWTPTFPIYENDGSINFVAGGYVIVAASQYDGSEFSPLPYYIVMDMEETQFTKTMMLDAFAAAKRMQTDFYNKYGSEEDKNMVNANN